jgi:hypothetical protein
VKQWHEYQNKEFERYIGVLKEEDPFKLEEEKVLTIAEISKRKAKEEEQELEPEDYAVFSRYNLLKPIIAKLKQQASVTTAMQLVEINGHVTYPTVNG